MTTKKKHFKAWKCATFHRLPVGLLLEALRLIQGHILLAVLGGFWTPPSPGTQCKLLESWPVRVCATHLTQQ